MTVDRGSMAGPPRLRALSGPRSDSLADVLERVLDKGVVIVGDVVISVLDVELLTLKLRLFIASADTAREMGLDWWTTDPFYSREARSLRREEERELSTQTVRALRAENEELRSRLAMLECARPDFLPRGGRSTPEPGEATVARTATGPREDPAGAADEPRPFHALDWERRTRRGPGRR